MTNEEIREQLHDHARQRQLDMVALYRGFAERARAANDADAAADYERMAERERSVPLPNVA